MRVQDPFGFAGAIQLPKDKKTINKVHKILFKKEIKEGKCPMCKKKLTEYKWKVICNHCGYEKLNDEIWDK